MPQSHITVPHFTRSHSLRRRPMGTLSRLSATITGVHIHALRHSPPLITRRHHIAACSAAAAQPQFDYDLLHMYNNYDDDDDGGERTNPPVAALNTDSLRPYRGVQWVFIGNPDAKKHVYAEMMSKFLHVPHISITSLLRQDLNPNSPLYKQIAEAINYKKIVPETIIFGLLSKRLEDGRYRGETGFILDGIPRTHLQAEILDQLVDIDLVVNFKRCGVHFQSEKSTADSSVPCDTTPTAKSDFSILSETNEDVKPNVTTFYRQQMSLMEDYYQKQKKLIDFQVGHAPGETWKGLLAALI
ncbi:hypothetical protein RND81_10G199500 [Saponaria officinalis]|uniref:adenylate kinase n=1 Tax=Saponaria officinalis TaxID=3572 RepID=A0AAW1I3X5_SAPOF